MQSFSELTLSLAVSRAIEELGYTVPTPIQAETLPLLLAGPTDFLGLAATGTGKTAAFAIPLVEGIDPTIRQVQALILCPTRELAMQVTEQINLLGKHKGVRAMSIFGGTGYGDQLKGLRAGTPVIVATPGRLIDHLSQGKVDFSAVRTVILDEADEMISMGFKDELEQILESMEDNEHQTWLFSATMSSEVRRVADRFLNDPKTVQINKSEMLSGTVEQIFYKTRESDKPEILCKLIDAAEEFYGLVFCQTKALVIDLNDHLKSHGYSVDCLHGDMDQPARDRVMKAFRERRVEILVCTDVACRGLDVKDLTHVVNYSIPRELDNYVHRIGRTGRSGKTGLALSLVTPTHFGLVSRIERMTRSRMKLGTIPSRKEIAKVKIERSLSKFENVAGFERAMELLKGPWAEKLETLSKEEIAARFLTLNFSDLFMDRAEPARDASPVRVVGNSTVVISSAGRVTSAPRASTSGPRIQPLTTPLAETEARAQTPAYVDALDETAEIVAHPVSAMAPVSLSGIAEDASDLYLPADGAAPKTAKAAKSAKTGKASKAAKPAKAKKPLAAVSSLSELLTSDGEDVIDVAGDDEIEIETAEIMEMEVEEVSKPVKVAAGNASNGPAIKPLSSPKPARAAWKSDRERPARTFGGDRPERKPRFGGGERPSFGDKPRFGGGERPSFGDKPRFGSVGKPRFGGGERPSFGDKPRFGGGERPSFGDKPRFGSVGKPRFGGGERPSFGDKPRFGKKPFAKPAGTVGGWKKEREAGAPAWAEEGLGRKGFSSERPSAPAKRSTSYSKAAGSEGGFKPFRKRKVDSATQG